MYVLLVPFVVLLMLPSSRSTNHIVISLKLHTAYRIFRAPRGGNLKMLCRGCRVDGVILSNGILLWLPESSDLCVVLHCHAEATLCINGGNFKGVPLKIVCS
jgi:hypothetical protein